MNWWKKWRSKQGNSMISPCKRKCVMHVRKPAWKVMVNPLRTIGTHNGVTWCFYMPFLYKKGIWVSGQKILKASSNFTNPLSYLKVKVLFVCMEYIKIHGPMCSGGLLSKMWSVSALSWEVKDIMYVCILIQTNTTSIYIWAFVLNKMIWSLQNKRENHEILLSSTTWDRSPALPKSQPFLNSSQMSSSMLEYHPYSWAYF